MGALLIMISNGNLIQIGIGLALVIPFGIKEIKLKANKKKE